MNSHLLRWALLCVAATPGLLCVRSASASSTVVVKPGDTISTLAHKFHVSIKDIAKANRLSDSDVLADGQKLVIPSPPKSVVKPETMRRSASIRGDRISIRQGPNEDYRRVTLLDNGSAVTVTRQAGEWLQVKLDSGSAGWVRSDFVRMSGEKSTQLRGVSRPKVQVAAKAKAHEKTKRRIVRRDDDEEDARPARVTGSKRSKRHALLTAKAETHRKAEAKAHMRRLASLQRSHRATRMQRHSRYAMHRRGGRPEAEAPNVSNDVVQTAYAYRGVPYHFGGSSKRGFDCSGFTGYVYRNKGVSLPRTAAEQFHRGKKVSGGQMKPGDLVFFHTTRKGVSHVGIYAGKGKFVHASSGGGRVRVDSLNSGYYKQRLVGARRVKEVKESKPKEEPAEE